ncbi:unnamed protein product [Ectocarpus sp. CCAP 1310/34]|nr:unnamed protein product [Ectocarpus sp. CCAP 1310/34]
MWDVTRELATHATGADGGEVGAGGGGGAGASEEGSSFKERIEIPLAVLILILYVVLGHSLELWKDAHKADASGGFLCTFHESGPAILLGLAVGLMVNYGVGQQFDFNADVFFYVVLPPIIFHQGYALKKRNFFKYFHYIFSFGFLGTVIQFITITVLALYASNSQYTSMLRDDGVPIGLSVHECMLMAAVFSAADEVATLSLIKQAEFPKLSAVLFGEGVLNDAMSILLFQTVQSGEENSGTTATATATAASSSQSGLGLLGLLAQAMYILVSAAGVGMGSGLMISKLLKSLDTLKSSPVRQVAILMLGGYLSFSLSEALDLSGILAVFFCGLTLSHYAWHSLGENAQVASKITSETISMIAEAYCFVAIGLSVHEFDASQWCWGFIVVMVLVLMTARALSVYGICLGGRLCFPKSFSMPVAEQHVLFFGGLVRGAIAWAQARRGPSARRTPGADGDHLAGCDRVHHRLLRGGDAVLHEGAQARAHGAPAKHVQVPARGRFYQRELVLRPLQRHDGQHERLQCLELRGKPSVCQRHSAQVVERLRQPFHEGYVRGQAPRQYQHFRREPFQQRRHQ